jgi:hypothetical protein
MREVFVLVENEIVPVDFGEDRPQSAYHLTTCEEALWSIGAKDIMAFDGAVWRRIA